MKQIFFAILAAVTLLSSCQPYEPQSPTLECDYWEMPVGLSSASSVVWHDTLFVLFGRSGQSAKTPHLYGYAVSLDDPSLVRRFPLPIKQRVKAAGLLIGDDYYFGLGFCGKVYNDTSNLTDWWRLDMNTRSLTRLADFPTKECDDPQVWAYGDSIFLSLGFTPYSRSTYRYDINADKWQCVSSNTIDRVRASAVGAQVGDRMFAGGGCSFEMFNDWNEFNHHTYRWEKRREMPTRGRIFCASAATAQHIYVIGGRYFGGTETDEHFYRGIIRYNVDTDSWTIVGDMPEAAEHQIAFIYNGYLYWGLGQTESKRMINRLYRTKL